MADLCWRILGNTFYVLAMAGAFYPRTSKIYPVVVENLGIIAIVSEPLHFLLLLYCYVVNRYRTYKSIGGFAKSMVEVTTVGAAMILYHFGGCHYLCSLFSVLALVGITVDLHAWAHLLHFTSDISVSDVLLGAVMQVVVYTTANNFSVSIVILILCGGIIFYRYLSYSLPVTLTAVSVEFEKLLPAAVSRSFEKLPC